jgi:hypothetical protein
LRSRSVSFTPSVREADFNAYRRNRAFHARRQAMGGCRSQADSSCRRPGLASAVLRSASTTWSHRSTPSTLSTRPHEIR